ncbi:hypothetical protein [Bradyrhizobium sp. AS23.2]|uniref:hypothetical protein n=1 Tax=Bradyrhizobium sp. AS23.2 TaxID=1680155 RepID=UPI00093AE61B|nr:hypothetical protein [Bradyrhizobium sp. AS23.2]OKO85990.1 hypothetical protein AC630_04560 [Bradyrhizobium sp. AS23.2]
MFTRLAKFRSFEPRRAAYAAQPVTHSNDNLQGFLRPQGRRLRPTRALACRWYLVDGHLECRWDVADSGELPTADLDHQRIADRTSGPRLVRRAALKARASS